MVWPTGRTTRRRPSPPRYLPGAARILDEAVALDQQRILHLDRFHRQVRRVGDVHLHAVLAVLGEAAAEAAAERLEIDVVAVVARIVAEEHRGRVGAVRGADRGFGDRGRERADDHVDDALAVLARAATAAGNFALMSEPSGAWMSTMSIRPWLFGTSGSSSALSE